MSETSRRQKKAIESKTGFKKTKVGWIPEDWESLVIGDLIKFSGGSQPPRSTFRYEKLDGYVRLIQTRDYRTDKYKTYIKKSNVKKHCKKNDIMIGRYGPPIFQLFKGLEGAYNVALIKAIPNEKKVRKDYTWFYLNRRDLRAYLESLSQRSGGQTGVEMDLLKKYPFPLPNLSEQQKIASILSDWDVAIENVQSLIEKLKRRKKGLMQQLLTGKKRLPGFSEEWREQKLGALIIDCKKKTTEQDEYEILTSSNKGLLPQKEYFGKGRISDKKNIGFHVLPPNHITYRSRSDDGKFTFNLNELGYTGIISHYYPVFKMKDGDNKFFVEYANTNKNKFGRYSVGTSQLVLSFNEIKKMKVTFPSPEEQRAISNVLNIAHQEIAEQQNYLEQLQAQKKGLMQQLLTGKIRVKI